MQTIFRILFIILRDYFIHKKRMLKKDTQKSCFSNGSFLTSLKIPDDGIRFLNVKERVKYFSLT